MRSSIIPLLTLTLLLAGPVPAAVHADVIFSNGLTNTVSSPINDRVQVSNNTTVIFNAGGNVTAVIVGGPAVTVLDTSSVVNNAGVLVSGLSSTGIQARGSATVSIFGGSVTGRGGAVPLASPGIGISASDSTIVSILGGSVTGLGPFGGGGGVGISASGNATVSIFGGSISGGTGISASDNATVSIFGGDISGSLRSNRNAVITLVGTDFNLPFGDVQATSGFLTGTLADGSALNVTFQRGMFSPIPFLNIPPGRIVLVSAEVPEPSSVALVGVGVLGLLGYAWRRRVV